MLWLSQPRAALLAAFPLWTALYASRTSAAPIATAGISLTAQDWDETVKQGTWCVSRRIWLVTGSALTPGDGERQPRRFADTCLRPRFLVGYDRCRLIEHYS